MEHTKDQQVKQVVSHVVPDIIVQDVQHHAHYVQPEHIILEQEIQVVQIVQEENIKMQLDKQVVSHVVPELIVQEEQQHVHHVQLDIIIRVQNKQVVQHAQLENIRDQQVKHLVIHVVLIHIVQEEQHHVQIAQVDIVVLQVQQLLTIVGDIDIHKFIRLEKQQVVVLAKVGVIQLAWDYVQMLLVGIMDQEHVQ